MGGGEGECVDGDTYLWLKCNVHVAGQTSGHGSRGVEIDGDEILQVLAESKQLAVVDGVGHVGQLETLAEDFTHLKVLEDHLSRFAEERLSLHNKRRVRGTNYASAATRLTL